MDVMGLAILVMFWISVAMALISLFTKSDIDPHGYIIYSCLILVGITYVFSPLPDSDIRLWFNLGELFVLTFINYSTFGKKYRFLLKESLGTFKYFVHLCLIGILVFIALSFSKVNYLAIIIIIILMISDYRKIKTKL